MRSSYLLKNKVMVIAESFAGKLCPSSLAAITAGKKLSGQSVTAFIANTDATSIANQLSKIDGVSKILFNKEDRYNHSLPEEISPLLASLVESGEYTHIIAASSAMSKNIIPRTAVIFDSMPIADVISIENSNTYKRLTYAGNAVTTVKCSDKVSFITIRDTCFDKAAVLDSEIATAEEISIIDTPKSVSLNKGSGKSKWTEDIVVQSDKPSLTAASVVISGGRGLKKSENFKLLEDMATPLKAAVGATRAVVDAEWCPNDMQIGQTGKVVAPNLYFAVGLSGAIQHVAGMKDSKTIVAINTDADAPIFAVSDYGLVEDLFTAVPKLTESFNSLK